MLWNSWRVTELRNYLPAENRRAMFALMSAVGFNPAPVNEVEELRKAYGSLNDVSRNVASAQACLGKDDKRMAEHHLKAAEWHLDQAKKSIASVGGIKARQ